MRGDLLGSKRGYVSMYELCIRIVSSVGLFAGSITVDSRFHMDACILQTARQPTSAAENIDCDYSAIGRRWSHRWGIRIQAKYTKTVLGFESIIE